MIHEVSKQELLENRLKKGTLNTDLIKVNISQQLMDLGKNINAKDSDSTMNQSDSNTNELPKVQDFNSNNQKVIDTPAKFCVPAPMIISDVNIIHDVWSNSPTAIVPTNSNFTPLPMPSPVRTLSGFRRQRKSKVDSPNIKRTCTRNEQRIDEIFKPKIPNENSADSLHDNDASTTFPEDSRKTDNLRAPIINSDSIPTDFELIKLKRKVADLENEIELLHKDNENNVENMKRSREMTTKILIQLTELERKATKARMTENILRLGQFKQSRVGAHYEEKWCEGVKYQDLDKRKKSIEKQKEENEKNKKLWNKKKSTRQKGSVKTFSSQSEMNEYHSQAEIYEIRKLNIEKEEKEIQSEIERFDLERNLHIREIKRLNSEESSRFQDFPILNERYLILSLLGKGGFSEVHKGFDLEQMCFVACKIHELAPNWTQDKKDSYIKHALREISIHKSLDHNRIVKVHDVFNIDNDAFCTVLECCEGNDLDFFLKQNKYIPEREAKSIICQLVSALRYLNDRKNPIIHYDLKPGNILLNNSGEIKITDFGLSKIFPDDHHNPEGMELTSQGAGTYWYLPPECFVTENGPPTISSKVDVWSVGVIFYQSLYGRKPFGNNMTQTDILHNNTILQARFITFPSNPKVSDAAKDFIKKCCTYLKEHRPDVFQLCNEDYLKPKAQLKHNVDVPALPGPSAFVPPVPQASNPQASQMMTSSSYN